MLTRCTKFSVFFVALASPWSRVDAQSPVDFAREVLPLFERNCAAGSCHIGRSTSGVELTSYEAVVASVGKQYGGTVVIPFDSAASPVVDKIASPEPRFGQPMPLGGLPLEPAEVALIARWIDEGARPATRVTLRGDITRDDRLDVSDAISILGFLFLGDLPPHCDPVADADADDQINITDAIYILDYLFLGGPSLPPLSAAEENECTITNRPPDVEPIGTIEGREGLTIRFRVLAIDFDRDSMTFAAEEVPDGLRVDARSGEVDWTPRVGQSGDHRVRIRVTDDGLPPESALATGLIRVRQGNQAPVLESFETLYGREGVPLEFTWNASDSDGDAFVYELITAPEGSLLDAESGRFAWTPSAGQAGEHALAIRVTDDGSPPRATEGETTIVVVPTDAPVNQPPFAPSRPVYRTYPGRPIDIPLGASDPDGDTIVYKVGSLPSGARFEEESGRLRWTPSDEQLGPHYVTVEIEDSGVPPLAVESHLIFRVMPSDPCARPDCDPETGCTEDVADIVESCCVEEPTRRVAEPVAKCPDGRVLQVGRNRRGFGRLQNCDWLRVEPFGQGGHTVALNVEARCINTDEPVSVRLRLETLDHVLFDRESAGPAQVRSDGFAQRLGFFMEVDRDIPVFELEGAEALLTCVLTDADGLRLERRLRLVLTRGGLDDLPEPDTADVPSGEAGCVGCHRPVSADGERHGIEEAHPWHLLTCIDCHGGNSEAVTRAEAHVSPTEGDPAYLRGLASDVLDRVSPDYLRFVNPGDLRVASRGCGSESPASAGGGCHQSVVDSVKKSVMSTYAGHYTLPRYLAGVQDREAIVAAVDVVDEDYDAKTAPAGAVPELSALREPPAEMPRDTIGACMDVYLPKSCPTCHLGTFGPDNSPGNYRSSGCTACHMTYDESGLSSSADPAVDHDFPSHPLHHRLTTAIPTEQCARCHFQGGRIGFAYRGIREGGFAPEKTPANGVTLEKVLHAHGEDYYFVEEDDSNDVDETPPDVHFEAGMDCADCHVGGDVHGDGHLYVSERYQVGIRCEDCHGTVRSEIQPDPEDGLFKNSKGFALRRVRRTDDGRVILRVARSGEELEIPQIHRILESGINQAMVEAMGVQENGFSHTDSLECYACHTSWRQTCFGCHVTVDDRATGPNLTTGEESLGAISVSRDDYSLDFFALGRNRRGKITPLCSSMSVFVTYIDADGNTRFRDRVRTSGDGRRGFGWNPFHHHTVSRVPQNCDRCHSAEGGGNDAVLRETYGFGTGRIIVPDGSGTPHDVTAFLDEDGELIGDFPHPGTGPVPAEVRERAMQIRVTPHPRQ